MTRTELNEIRIDRPSEEIYREVKARWDSLAKPLDSMGKFEEFISQIGAILGTADIDISKKAVVAMCADNGIVEEKVTQSGQEITTAVTRAMGQGQSSVCRMARQIGADVIPVDVGIAGDEKLDGVLNKKIMRGTNNFIKEPAMTEQAALDALETGIEMVKSCKEQGYSIIATGEMGIGNTTTGSAVAAALTGCPADDITGRGAGLSDEGLKRKRKLINDALRKYDFDKKETLRILATVGGLDIAGMAGLYIGGAICHIPVVIDGVISAVSALVADRLVPGTRDYMIPSHISREKASVLVMDELHLCPVIDASMALGEGTGAVMMFGLLDMAMALYGRKVTFSDFGMEAYTRF